MNNISEKFKSSARDMKSPAALAVCAMLLAISIVLGYYGNISITFLGTNIIKLSFTAIPVAIAAMLYGPVCAAIIGALSDVIGFMLAPMGAYIPGFTISMILIGFVYGAAFYKEKHSLKRVAAAQLVVSVMISELLGSLWFVLFYGFKPVTALTVRGIKELIMFPVSVALIFAVMKVLDRIPEVNRIKNKSKAQ